MGRETKTIRGDSSIQTLLARRWKANWENIVFNRARFAIIFALLLITALVYGCTGQTGSSNQILEDIGIQEAFALVQSNQENPDFVIIDIRTPEEFDEGHIEDAVNVDFYAETFREELDKFDKSKTYFIYCRSGNRSGRAMPIMEELGFQEVYNLSAGIKEWIAEGLPVVR